MPYIGNITQDFNVNNAMLDTDSVTSIKIVDGTIEGADIAANLDLSDSQKIRFGAGNDLQIYHDGSNSYIQDTGTGDLLINTSQMRIKNAANDETMAIFSENGRVQLWYDNSAKFETTAGGVTISGDVSIDNDTGKFLSGAGNDLQLYHDGSNSVIDNLTGGLFIKGGDASNGITLQNRTGNESMAKFLPDGAVELYYDNAGPKLETSSTGISTDTIRMSGFSLPRTQVGGSDVLTFGHGGSFGELDCITGMMRIKAGEIQLANRFGNVEMLTCNSFGSVEIYHNGSKKFETTAAGGQFTGTEIKGPDNCKFVAGTSGDADFYHDGSATYLRNATGNLHIRSDNTIELQPYSGDEVYAKFINDGAVELYYDNSKKFETSSVGVSILGRLTTSGEYNYLQSSSTSTSTLTLKKSASGADAIDYLQLRNNSNGLIGVITGAGHIRPGADNAMDLGSTSLRWNDLWLGGSANIGNYIRTNYNNNGGGAHMYFKNNSQGANFSSHFQTYESSNESGTTQTHIHYYHGGYCELLHQGDSVIRTLADGVQFRDGGAVKGQFTDEGLCFGTDTAAANALDDYEEGTFTPTMTYNTLQQAPQGTFTGQYQKVGNCVHFQARFALTDEGSGIDNIRLSNLPFAPNTSSFTHPMATFFAISGVNIGDPDKMIVAQLQTNQYVFYTVGIADSDNYASFNMNQIVDSAIFGCYGHYYTSS